METKILKDDYTNKKTSFKKKRLYKHKKTSLKVSNDPIADLLIRIKNGGERKKNFVIIPFSKEKKEILDLLREEKYINICDVKGEKSKKHFVVYLKYYGNKLPTIKGVRRISKPGLRVYSKSEDLPRVLRGLGVAIISTSKGIMTDERARSQGIGGEVLAFVW